jgi:GNAT superfamily N-acetyltransferase
MMESVNVGSAPYAEAGTRRGRPSDADELARLRWIWRAVERDEVGDSERFREEFGSWVTDHERTHIPYLVEVGGQAVGMAWLAVIERIPGPEIWKRLAGHIQSVYVTSGHRDRGLGSLLIKELIEGARTEGLDYLLVHPSARSFPFYRRLGFTGQGSLLSLDLVRD